MERDDRRLVRRVVAAYLERHATERREDLELVFEPVYEVMTEAAEDGADDGHGDGERGLPIDASFLDGAVVSSAIWAAASLLHAWRARQGDEARGEAEERMSRELADPEMVRWIAAELRRELGAAEPASPAPVAPVRGDEGVAVPGGGRRNELVVGWRPGQAVLDLRLTAPVLGFDQRSYDPAPLRLDLYETCAKLIRDIETALDEADVASRGAMLFTDLLPEPLREHLWALHDRGARSLRIVSDEPWIPWEAVRLHGRRDDAHAAGPFLADAFDVVRWLPGRGAPRRLPWRRVAVVAPRDSGLPRAEDDVTDLLALGRGGRSVERLEARKEVVRRALASGRYDGWHFSAHGAVAKDRDAEHSYVELEEGRRLKAVDLRGEAERLGAVRPLVFLNACHAGRGGLSFTGVGGWAASFLRCGAGAFLGPLWSVRDSRAGRFSAGFYRRFLAGEPVAAAAAGARADLAGDPARLAYALYADPEARCAASSPGTG